MEKLEFGKRYRLFEIIEIISNNISENGFTNFYFYLYTEIDESNLTPELICFLEEGPQITDDDEEIYPDFVSENSLSLLYRGDRFEDVVMNVQHQKKDAKIEDYIAALDYYAKNDTFLDFE